MQDGIDEHLQSQKELPDIRQDLFNYVESIKDKQKDIEEIKAIFETAEHGTFVKDICKYLILSPENKANCVLIHGAPNAGKT